MAHTAEKSVMDMFGGRRPAVAARDVFVVQHRLQQPLKMDVGHARHNAAQLGPHFVRVAQRGGEVIAEIDFAVVHPPHFVDGHLRPVVEYLHQPLDLHEVVAVEVVDHFGHVVPHLGVQLAGPVGQQQRQIQLAALLLTNLLRVD
jgi:hypothetical protein